MFRTFVTRAAKGQRHEGNSPYHPYEAEPLQPSGRQICIFSGRFNSDADAIEQFRDMPAQLVGLVVHFCLGGPRLHGLGLGGRWLE
jgi:hypothetical protein